MLSFCEQGAYQQEREANCVDASIEEEVNCTLVDELVIDTKSPRQILLCEFAAR